MESKKCIYSDFLIFKILTKGLLGTLNSSTDVYDPVENITQNNENIYHTNFQNTIPVTVVAQINYNSPRPIISPPPPPTLFDYNSTHSNPSSSVFSQSSSIYKRLLC